MQRLAGVFGATHATTQTNAEIEQRRKIWIAFQTTVHKRQRGAWLIAQYVCKASVKIHFLSRIWNLFQQRVKARGGIVGVAIGKRGSSFNIFNHERKSLGCKKLNHLVAHLVHHLQFRLLLGFILCLAPIFESDRVQQIRGRFARALLRKCLDRSWKIGLFKNGYGSLATNSGAHATRNIEINSLRDGVIWKGLQSIFQQLHSLVVRLERPSLKNSTSGGQGQFSILRQTRRLIHNRIECRI